MNKKNTLLLIVLCTLCTRTVSAVGLAFDPARDFQAIGWRCDALVVGRLVSTNEPNSTAEVRLSRLHVDQVLWGVDARENLPILWRAEAWHDPETGMNWLRACGGETQLDREFGRPAIWSLRRSEDGLFMYHNPIWIDDLDQETIADGISGLEGMPRKWHLRGLNDASIADQQRAALALRNFLATLPGAPRSLRISSRTVSLRRQYYWARR